MNRLTVKATSRNPRGFSYQVVLPPIFEEVLEKFNPKFVQTHFDVLIPMILADLVCENRSIEINQDMIEMKIKKIPYYKEIYFALLDEQRKPAEEASNEKTSTPVNPESK